MPFLNRIGSGSTSKFGFRMGFVPGAPTSVTASLPSTYGNTTASVAWTAPVTLGSPAFSDYTIQYSSDSGGTWTTFTDTVSTATSVTVTGLVNGTAYVFRVAAVNNIGTGPYSTASNSVTPLFGKVPTPVVSDITETTSTIPWCFDNYASIDQDNGYVYNYYDFNVSAPNDQSGSCHGWTGLGENVYRETYLYVSKTGWANSDAIFLSESTNVSTPAPTPPPTTPVPTPPPTTAPPCAGCPAKDTVYYGQNCNGTFLQQVYSDGCCGQYVASAAEVPGYCGVPAATPPPTPAAPVNCSTGFTCTVGAVCSPLPPGASANCRVYTCTKAGCASYSYCAGPSCP